MQSEPAGGGAAHPVPRYARIDVLGGALMCFIAALILYGAVGLKLGTFVNIGPGALPYGLALLLLAAGAALLVRGLFAAPAGAEAPTFALRPPLVMSAAILFFAFFIRGGDFGILATPRLGLMAVGPATVILAGLATPEARLRELVVLAFGLTAAALLIFADLLGVPIPVFPRPVEAAIPLSFGAAAATRVLYVAYAVISGLLYLILIRRPGHPDD